MEPAEEVAALRRARRAALKVIVTTVVCYVGASALTFVAFTSDDRLPLAVALPLAYTVACIFSVRFWKRKALDPANKRLAELS